jgi:hypothetical protein
MELIDRVRGEIDRLCFSTSPEVQVLVQRLSFCEYRYMAGDWNWAAYGDGENTAEELLRYASRYKSV